MNRLIDFIMVSVDARRATTMFRSSKVVRRDFNVTLYSFCQLILLIYCLSRGYTALSLTLMTKAPVIEARPSLKLKDKEKKIIHEFEDLESTHFKNARDIVRKVMW